MLPNTNETTGIRYGVASMNSLADWAWEEFETRGTNLSLESALAEWRSENPQADEGSDEEQEFFDSYQSEEDCYALESEGLKLELGWLGGAALVWVIESPHQTHARQCSPCVPNAGDLDSPDPDGVECYTLPGEWFRSA
jgi:hypothetical protein